MLLKISKTATLILSLVAVSYFIGSRLSWILASDYPQSTDGFFYLQEIKHRIQHGTGYYVAYSPFFSIIQVISFLVPNASEVAIFKGIVVLSLAIFSCSLALNTSFKAQIWLIPSLFMIPWLSDVIFYRHFAFVKQAFSLSILLFGYSLFLCQKDGRSKTLLVPAACCMFIGLITHLFSAVILTVLAIYYLSAARFKNRTGVVLTVLLTSSVIAAWFVRDKPVLQYNFDTYLVSWVFFCKQTGCSGYEYIEFVLYAALFIIILFLSFKGRKMSDPVFLFLSGYLFLNLPIWDTGSEFVYRAAFSAVWLIVFSVSLAVRRGDNLTLQLMPVVLCSSLLAAYPFTSHLDPQEPYLSSQKLVQYRDQLKRWIDQDSFVLAPHGMQFKITYFLDRPSAKTLPDPELGLRIIRFLPSDPGDTECQSIDSASIAPEPDANCISIEGGWRFARR